MIRGVNPSGLWGAASRAASTIPLYDRPAEFRQTLLALDTIEASYDLALVDCPPNLGLLTVNGLLAADRLLVPVNMQDEGALQGVVELRGTLAKLAARGEARELDALLETRVDARRQVHHALAQGLHDLELPKPIAKVAERAAFQRAAIEGTPLVVSAPDSVGGLAYVRLAEALDERFALAERAAA